MIHRLIEFHGRAVLHSQFTFDFKHHGSLHFTSPDHTSPGFKTWGSYCSSPLPAGHRIPKPQGTSQNQGNVFFPSVLALSQHTALHCSPCHEAKCEPARSPLLPGPRWDHTEAGWLAGEAVTSMPGTQKVLVISRLNTKLKSMCRSQTQPHSAMWLLSQKGLDVGIDSCEISCWQGTVIPACHKPLQNQSRHLIWFLSSNEQSYINKSCRPPSLSYSSEKAEHPQHFLDFSVWKKN